MKAKLNSIYLLSLIALVILLASFTFPPATTKYVVDTNASTLVWVGKKFAGEHSGNTKLASGELITEGKVVKQGNFSIALETITNTDITNPEYNANLVEHLKSDDFFGVAKFPTAAFAISSVAVKTGDEYVVKGKLTIKGITNDVEFPAVIKNSGKQLTADAKIIVDRSKYDIRYKSKSFFSDLGDKFIYDEFELNIKLVATAQ